MAVTYKMTITERAAKILNNGWFILHVLLTYFLVWWSCILFYPESTFDTSLSYNGFAKIDRVENHWAILFGLSAIVGIIGCYYSRHNERNIRNNLICFVSAAVLAINHGAIALLMFQGNPVGTGTGMYLGSMMVAWLLAAREVTRIA